MMDEIDDILPDPPPPADVVSFQGRVCWVRGGVWYGQVADLPLVDRLNRLTVTLDPPPEGVNPDSHVAWECARLFRGDVMKLSDNTPAERDAPDA